MIKILVFLLFAALAGPLYSTTEFTVEEVTKIRQILHQMITILEGNHQEILEIEEVLSRTNTQLRKARAKETMERKLKSFRDRIRDIKTLRNGFVHSRQLKEFIIGLDDRIRVMEQNLTMIEDIYFPQILANEEAVDQQNEYPTFINPGDPRFELDEEEMRLSRAIRNTRDLMTLRNSREPVEDNFDGFINEFDRNLKEEEKPQRHDVPVMGGLHALDEFHEQLEEAQRKDRNFDWNENRNHREFRDFFQDVEQFDREATVNRRIVTGFPEVDDGGGAQSRKAFFELMENVQLKARQEEEKQVLVQPVGSLDKLKGFAGFMNDVRIDGHEVTKKDFSEFINELEPVRSEVTLKYQKGILKQDKQPEVILRRETVAWHETDLNYLQRLRHQRLFEQADEFYEGETLMADRMRVKTKTKPFSLPHNFSDFEKEAGEYLEHHDRVAAHDYVGVTHAENAGFFVRENSSQVREVIRQVPPAPVSQALHQENRLLPILVQLVDEEKVPFVDNDVEFRIELSPQAAAVNLQARFIEGAGRQSKVRVKTNQNGEATANLLLDLQGHEVRIERDVEYSSAKVTCLVKIDLETQGADRNP